MYRIPKLILKNMRFFFWRCMWVTSIDAASPNTSQIRYLQVKAICISFFPSTLKMTRWNRLRSKAFVVKATSQESFVDTFVFYLFNKVYFAPNNHRNQWILLFVFCENLWNLSLYLWNSIFQFQFLRDVLQYIQLISDKDGVILQRILMQYNRGQLLYLYCYVICAHYIDSSFVKSHHTSISLVCNHKKARSNKKQLWFRSDI